MYTHTHMNNYLVNRGALKGVLKCTLNKIVLMICAMSMCKDFSQDLGWWTLIYDLWTNHIGSKSPTSNFIKLMYNGFSIKWT